MIRSLAGNCAPILDCSRDVEKTVAETPSDKMVMGAVWALCEFPLLVSQPNHSDLSLTALDDALKRFHKKKGAFRQQKMSKSAKAKVDEQLATVSHQLREQQLHTICDVMEIPVYEPDMVTTTQ